MRSFEGQALAVVESAAAPVVVEAAAVVEAGRSFPVGFAECWQADFEAGLLPVAVRVLGGRVVSRRAASKGKAAAAFRGVKG